jgi:hypothetical protein
MRWSIALIVALAFTVACNDNPVDPAEQVAGDVATAPSFSSHSNAAFVSNSGRDDQTCTLSGPWSGTGDATRVTNNGGNTSWSCAGSVNETPPDKAVHLQANAGACKVVVTPSGNFSASCHWK